MTGYIVLHGNIILEPSAMYQKDSPGTLFLSVIEPTHLSTTLPSLFSEAIESSSFLYSYRLEKWSSMRSPLSLACLVALPNYKL